MTRPLTWLLAGAALSLCVAAGGATAQPPDQARAEAERDSAAAAPRADEPRRIERREVRVYRSRDSDGDGVRERTYTMRGEDRAEHLRTMLQLRPEQEGALKAFLAATGPEHREPLVRFNPGDNRTTIDRLNDIESKLAAQQAATRSRIAATRAFYAALDVRQRKVFDEMPMLMMVGPDLGPMLIPAAFPMAMHMRHMVEPPAPPLPPAPPPPPRPPLS